MSGGEVKFHHHFAGFRGNIGHFHLVAGKKTFFSIFTG